MFKTRNSKHEERKFFFLENKLKKLENNANYIEKSENMECRNKLDKIYE